MKMKYLVFSGLLIGMMSCQKYGDTYEGRYSGVQHDSKGIYEREVGVQINEYHAKQEVYADFIDMRLIQIADNGSFTFLDDPLTEFEESGSGVFNGNKLVFEYRDTNGLVSFSGRWSDNLGY